MRRLGLVTVGTPQNAPELQDPEVAKHVGQIITNTTRISDIERVRQQWPWVKILYMCDPGYIAVKNARGGNSRDYWFQWDDQQLLDPMAAVAHQAYFQHGRGISWFQDYDMAQHMPGNTQRALGWCTSDCPRGRGGDGDGMKLLEYTAQVLQDWWTWNQNYSRPPFDGIHLDGWPRIVAGAHGLADRAENLEQEFSRYIIPVLMRIGMTGRVSCTAWGPAPYWPWTDTWATALKCEDYWIGSGQPWQTDWIDFWDINAPWGDRNGWKVAATPGSTFMVRPGSTSSDLVAHAVNTFLLCASNGDDGPYFSLQHTQGYGAYNFRQTHPLLFRRVTESKATGEYEEIGNSCVWRPFEHPSRLKRMFVDRYFGVLHGRGLEPSAIYQDKSSRFWRRISRR